MCLWLSQSIFKNDILYVNWSIIFKYNRMKSSDFDKLDDFYRMKKE